MIPSAAPSTSNYARDTIAGVKNMHKNPSAWQTKAADTATQKVL